jgi:hypothetical protein
MLLYKLSYYTFSLDSLFYILYAAVWEHRRTPWEIKSGGKGSGFINQPMVVKPVLKLHKVILLRRVKWL